MTFDLEDTICAIASAPGGALRGIVRLSGPATLRCLAGAVGPAEYHNLGAIRSSSCVSTTLKLAGDLGQVPVRLYWWPTTRSYTRQPSAELHLPGSPPILAAALDAVCSAGARLARPGEFTLRALLAGRLDLTQAEAVLGVIDAQSRTELEVALGQLAGGLARPLAELRGNLLDLLAELEAGLDFAEEDNQFITPGELDSQLTRLGNRLAEVEQQMESRGVAGSVLRVVLVGLPNAGKSSLLNALSQDAAAIVSEVPGTTRDFVARRLSLGGREIVLTDTAGILPPLPGGEIDAIAQQMTRAQLEQADLTVLCLDASRPLAVWEREQLRLAPPIRRLVVWTKCDLIPASDASEPLLAIRTSSVTGEGIDHLRQAITSQLNATAGEVRVVVGTAERCRDSLRLTGESLTRAITAARANGGDELVAAEIRNALDELGRVIGAVYTDDVLDRIFSRFCIGK